MKLITNRYYIKPVDADAHTLNFAVITGTDEQHKAYIDALRSDNTIVSVLCEYVCEFDSDNFMKVTAIFNKENDNETN